MTTATPCPCPQTCPCPHLSLNGINAVELTMRSHTHDHVISKLHLFLLDRTSREQKRTKKTVDQITSSKNRPHYLSRIDKKLYSLIENFFRKTAQKRRLHFDQTSPKIRNPQQQKHPATQREKQPKCAGKPPNWQHWRQRKPEMAGVTFSDSESAPVSKFLSPDPGPAIFQI